MSRRRRVHAKRLKRLGLAYLVVISISFGLLQLEMERAVPVFGPTPAPGHRVGQWVSLSGWKGILAAGFPHLAYADLPRRTSLAWPDQVLMWVAGIRTGDTKSVLDAEIPALTPLRLDLYVAGPATPTDLPEVTVRLPPGTASGEQPALAHPSPVLVGIYHTHGREAFLPEMGPGYRFPEEAHTDNLEVTIMRVGREIARLLQEQYGIGVVHSPEIHDIPGRVGAYVRSAVTASRMLREHPTIQLLLDVHRDSQVRAHTTATVNGVSMGRVMLVLGTENPGWRDNYQVAKDFLGRLEAAHPGLTIGIYTKPGRYNQHLFARALLIEVGGVENTMEESLRSAAAIARVVAEMVGWGGGR